MKKTLLATLAASCLALGGCFSTGNELLDVGFSFVKDNPSAIPCLSEEAAAILGPALPADVRKINQQTRRITKAYCDKLSKQQASAQ